MELIEQELIDLLKKGDADAFEKVFKTYFKNLHAYALYILKNSESAREVIQQVFYKIWEKRVSLNIHTSMKAYLYKSVYNECMLQLKKKKNKEAYLSYILKQDANKLAQGASEKIETTDLEIRLQKALNELPEQCRTIFQLNRFEGLKYHEIASQMSLSLKTIENQMGKALKRLRIALAEFLPLIIYLLWQV
ncbi:RNA polymerase sigma-70 factor [Pseudoflavitalea sp. X16]|uniref:RNA polymerase sigma-70 factor n=1 Tax=Paraflavitalea devenefica TaxID=2716334 RepID=UPI00142278EF|nr:RNA polymerase sigma-70 factor [Paraflavitalea devenefica]NII28637.1 RNA polymerase sigma-70 factor [Paraflavitalea devenefica]